MLKKKSYMSRKNIIDEGILDSIYKAILSGKGRQIQKSLGKNKKLKNIAIDVAKLNNIHDDLANQLKKVYGIDIKKSSLSLSDLIKSK